jgi:phosphoglycolate phosphatase-like HAD superfamily hydrolase
VRSNHESKPDPDIVHAALKKIGINASEAVMIGDTPYDVEAATRAGVYDGPWDLFARLADSPVAHPNFQIPNPKTRN